MARFKLDPSHRWGIEVYSAMPSIYYRFELDAYIIYQRARKRYLYYIDKNFYTKEEFKRLLAVRKTELYKAVYSEEK